jgi:hypothetical protein
MAAFLRMDSPRDSRITPHHLAPEVTAVTLTKMPPVSGVAAARLPRVQGCRPPVPRSPLHNRRRARVVDTPPRTLSERLEEGGTKTGWPSRWILLRGGSLVVGDDPLVDGAPQQIQLDDRRPLLAERRNPLGRRETGPQWKGMADFMPACMPGRMPAASTDAMPGFCAGRATSADAADARPGCSPG